MKQVLILFALLLITSFAFADVTPPVTTFSSFQVPNTTDQNITLICTDNNTGCKTINYNINNTGWNEYNYSIDLNNTYSLTDNNVYSTNSRSFVLKETYYFPNDNNSVSFINSAKIKLAVPATYNDYSSSAKLIYYYSDGTSSSSDTVTKWGEQPEMQYVEYNFNTLSNNLKKLDYVELYIVRGGASSYTGVYAFAKDLIMDINYGKYSSENNYSFIYSGSGDHNIQYFSTDNSDNNETIKTSNFPQFQTTNEPSNSRVLLQGVNQYNDYTVTNWLWIIDGTPLSGTTDQNKYYSTQANEDLNVCLTTNSLDTTCRSVNTWDTIEPTIDANIETSTFGFVTTYDINYNLTCYDNFSPINYKIEWINDGNTTTLYEDSDTNGTTITDTLSIAAGQSAQIRFTCSDEYNTTTYLSETVYALNFRLVNEFNGLQLTASEIGNDFNILRVYTLDGNYSFNFKDANTVIRTFFSPTTDLWFEIGYKDTVNTNLNRQINFKYIEDQNIAVCIPKYQTFYQQRFVANTAREMILQNNVSGCYVAASTLDYVYDTGYALTTYTIPKPYYLYIWVNGVKTFLALIDGSIATQYNLDAIAFSRTEFDITVGEDIVAFQPLINTVTGLYDTNTIIIYYKSYAQDNAQTSLTIKNDSNTIWDYIETNSPNELQVNFYWGWLGLTNEDVLELIITTIDSSGESITKSYYFTTQGTYYPNEGANSWVVIVAILFFLFGITLVAATRAFGIFGIIICIVSIAITAMASGAWWISLTQGVFLLCLIYIFMMGKTQAGELG